MTAFSNDCLSLLSLLKERRNVLVSGPPGTGKSTLLNEVARAFLAKGASVSSSTPALQPQGKVPIPSMSARTALDPSVSKVLPASDRSERRVFSTVFHQNMKYRDFVSGITPSLTTPGQFDVSEGVLLKASEFAMQPGGTALLVIDEINRGPAVQIFGGAIVAMEGDKRLAPDGKPQDTTQTFELLHPVHKTQVSYAFPNHLYILAAMNQADVSVDALDVAFLRRWAPYKLMPSEGVLRSHLGLGTKAALPETPAGASDIYEALVQAWSAVNERIVLGRGPEFQIGHGTLMGVTTPGSTELNAVLAQASAAWDLVLTHLEEVFFADVRGVAATLNATEGGGSVGYVLANESFGGEPRNILRRPEFTPDRAYKILKSVI